MSEDISVTPVPFERGQTVVVGRGEGLARRWYRTWIRRVDSQIIWLDGTADGNEPLNLLPGDVVTCHTWRYMDAAYQAEARVSLTRLAPEPLVGITVLSSRRIQQREYVRVPIAMEAWGLHIATDPAAEDAEEEEALHIDVRDLSAGGLRGRADRLLLPGDELELELNLPASRSGKEDPLHLRGRVIALPNAPEPLSLRARVVRLVESTLPENLTCEIGVAFLDVTREARERIIRFALDVQRDHRRRGLL